MRVDVAPQRVEASPDEPVAVTVDVYNSSEIIEGFAVELDGLPAHAWRAEPASLSLFPDTSGIVVLTFTPPALFPAGENVLTMRVVSTVDRSVVHSEQLQLFVHPKKDAQLAVSPESVTAGQRTEFVTSVDNRGNVPLELELSGADREGALRFAFQAPTVVVEPGHQSQVPVRVHGRRPILGTPKPRMLTIGAREVATPDGVSVSAPATFVQKPWVPRSLLVVAAVLAPVALLALVVAGAVDAILGAGAQQEAGRIAAEEAEEEAARETIVNAPPGTIEGTVLAADLPASAVAVYLYVAATDPVERGREAGDVVAHTVTGPDGTYELSDVTTPATYQVVFSVEGFAREAVEVELGIGEGKSGVDAVLRPLDGAISGVVLAEGDPVGGATVTASDGLNQAEAVTATEGQVGTFILDKLPTPGTYMVTVSRPETPPVAQPLTLEAGQRLTDVVLEMPTHIRTVSGTVRDDGGQPLGEVTVTVRPAPEAGAPFGTAPDQPEAPSTTPPPLLTTTSAAAGAVGRYSLEVAAPARYEISFERPGYVPTVRTLAVTAEEDVTDFDAVLAPMGSVIVGTVTVVDRPGSCEEPPCPVPNIEVLASGHAGQRTTRTANEPPGVYVIEGLQPGTWTLTFNGGERFATTTRLVEVPPGAQLTVDVVLEGAPGTITVRGPEPQGPIEGAIPGPQPACSDLRILLLDREGNPIPGRVRDSFDADFAFAGLATPDLYIVRIERREPREVLERREVLLGPGGGQMVEVGCTR